jgi:hypothetical protein
MWLMTTAQPGILVAGMWTVVQRMTRCGLTYVARPLAPLPRGAVDESQQARPKVL